MRSRLLGLAASREAVAEAPRDGHGGESFVVFLPVAEIGIGDGAIFEIGLAFVEDDELVGMGIGQRIQKNAVDHGEQGSVGADAEGQGKDGDRGEAGILAERTGAKAQILNEFFEPEPAPLFARDAFDQGNIAEFAAGCLFGFLG